MLRGTTALHMSGYYATRLSAERLQRCYDVAPPRIQQYLAAEIEFVLARSEATHRVLELGCGYGRAMDLIAPHVKLVDGVDTSDESLECARTYLSKHHNCSIHAMDASHMNFDDGVFDLVICIQNGISAFHVEPIQLIHEALRVTRRGGGCAMFSTYAASIWSDRLEWFRRQAEEGLIGPIDEVRTGNGTIVCTDGFCATTFSKTELRAKCEQIGADCTITEIDQSSLFCEVHRV